MLKFIKLALLLRAFLSSTKLFLILKSFPGVLLKLLLQIFDLKFLFSYVKSL